MDISARHSMVAAHVAHRADNPMLATAATRGSAASAATISAMPQPAFAITHQLWSIQLMFARSMACRTAMPSEASPTSRLASTRLGL